jgi:nitrate reductase cytochrome c-type subunit
MSRRLLLIPAALLAIGAIVWLLLPRILYPYIDRPPMIPKLHPLRELGSLSAVRCGACHQEIFREWSSSLMAQSATNSFFLTERSHNPAAFLCGRCHYPLENQERELLLGLSSLDPLVPITRANPSFDEILSKEGVTCVVCHMRPGTAAILNARILTAATPPHPLVVGLDETICKRCHQFDPIGGDTFRPPLDTFNEHAEYRAAGGKNSCVDCHMPAIERRSAASAPVRTGHDHRFLGARDGAFIARHLSATITRAGDQWIVELENRAGHRLPTGEPSRVLRARIERLGAEGPVPLAAISIQRDMDTIRVVDRSDTTLAPGERRRIRVPAPDDSDARVVVELLRAANEEHHVAHVVTATSSR